MNKYSVIVPCYKEEERDLRRCFDSIKNQTLKPYEVICIDDFSPIKNPQIAKEYGFKYIRHEVNKNNGGARNTGIREATGDYLVFVNADDYILEDTLEEIDKVNKGQDLILIGFKAYGVWDEEFIPSEDTVPYYTKLGWNGEPLHVVRRDFIIENNLYEQEGVVFADIEWAKKVEEKAKSYGYVSKALYRFQTGNPNSLTTKVSSGEIEV